MSESIEAAQAGPEGNGAAVEAKALVGCAAQLDLTQSEKSELARHP